MFMTVYPCICIACAINIVGDLKKTFSLLHAPYWSMISSLLHLVGLRLRVYYTLAILGGGARPERLKGFINVSKFVFNYYNFNCL